MTDGLAMWRRGYAEVCKTSYSSSILDVASRTCYNLHQYLKQTVINGEGGEEGNSDEALSLFVAHHVAGRIRTRERSETTERLDIVPGK